MSEDISLIAFEYYGTCIGSKYCLERTITFLMEEHGLDQEKAETVARAAFNEWIDAYS